MSGCPAALEVLISTLEGVVEEPRLSSIGSEPNFENKTCSGCQQDVRKSVTQADRQTDRLTDRQKDRYKTERLFSLVIKTKVAKNVNRMSER